MDKTIRNFDDTEIEECKFHQHNMDVNKNNSI